MGKFVKVGKTSDISDGKMKLFQINGKQITVANTQGEYLAFDDRCTHAGCSLAAGVLNSHNVTCYCHGAQFDAKTGKVIAPPAVKPLNIYNVKVEGEEILVEI